MTHSGILSALLLLQFGGGGGGMGSLSPFLVQVVLILGIFYFFLIRPQAQQKKKHEEALRSIKRGDRIVTFGGILGEVVNIREVTIKSAESRLVVERGKIARIVGGSSVPTKE